MPPPRRWQPHEDRPEDAFFNVHQQDPAFVADVWLDLEGTWTWMVTHNGVELDRWKEPRLVDAQHHAARALQRMWVRHRIAVRSGA